MKYYGQWSGGNLASKTSDLLQYKDGMCMAWTRLLLDALKVHGFQESDNFVIVTAAQSEGFFIKEWKKNVAQGTSGNPNYPYKNVANNPLYNANNSYNWASSEVILNKASAAQNNANPQSDFRNHIFAKINGTFYDPSYGLFYMKSEIIPDPIDPSITMGVIPI
jgi:hypothetical protein